MLEESADTANRDFWNWSRKDTHRYFLAGGGREDEFDALWSTAVVTATNLKRRLPTPPTPAAELPSNILSPAESRPPLRASDARIAFP